MLGGWFARPLRRAPPQLSRNYGPPDITSGAIRSTTSYAPWDEAERAVRLHVAQLGWDIATDLDPDYVPEIMLHPEDQR